MTVYLIFFWFLALAALLMELRLTKGARLAVFSFSFLLLVVFVGLRWETGNDWAQYISYYKHLHSLHDMMYNNSDTWEIGYKAFNLCIKDLGLPYAAFTFFYAATYLGLMFLSFKRDNYEISGWIILQLFAPFILGLMGTQRQVMSVAICMFSVHYVVSREWKKFLLCVLIATAFHVSAVAFLLAWPIARIQIKAKRILGILVVLTAALVLNLGDVLSNSAATLLGKLNMADLAQKFALEQLASPEQFDYAAGSNVTIMSTIARIAVLLLSLLCLRFFSREADQLYIKLYIAGFVALFLLSGPLYVLAERVSLYFTIFQIHLLALPTRRLRRPVLRTFYCAALIVLSLSRLYTAIYARHPEIFVPYKGVLINSDVKRDIGWFHNDY